MCRKGLAVIVSPPPWAVRASARRGLLLHTLRRFLHSQDMAVPHDTADLRQASLAHSPLPTTLRLAAQGSSTVKLLTTYLSSEIRISRPVLSLQGVEADGGFFIYARARDAI